MAQETVWENSPVGVGSLEVRTDAFITSENEFTGVNGQFMFDEL